MGEAHRLQQLNVPDNPVLGAVPYVYENGYRHCYEHETVPCVLSVTHKHRSEYRYSTRRRQRRSPSLRRDELERTDWFSSERSKAFRQKVAT